MQLAQGEVTAQEECSIVTELQMHLVNSPSGPVMLFGTFFIIIFLFFQQLRNQIVNKLNFLYFSCCTSIHWKLQAEDGEGRQTPQQGICQMMHLAHTNPEGARVNKSEQ